MIELPSVLVVLAASVSGMVLGFSLRTSVEYKFHVTRERCFPTLQPRSRFGVAITQVIGLLIISFLMVVPAVIIMRIGDVYPLSETDRYTFVFFWFLSISCAKYLRYCYWKKRSGKSL